MLDSARTRAGKAEVEGVDAERIHQVENFDLFADRGVADGRRLQTVAESFVVEQCGLYFCGGVPVVD